MGLGEHQPAEGEERRIGSVFIGSVYMLPDTAMFYVDLRTAGDRPNAAFGNPNSWSCESE